MNRALIDQPLRGTGDVGGQGGLRQCGEGTRMTVRQGQMFAVAVRDESDLFLWLRLCRNKKGEIFCIYPTGSYSWSELKWDPHRSEHADGTTHCKSHGVKPHVKSLQKPDEAFAGTENLTTRSTPADEPRAWGVRCIPTDFDGVFELSVSELDATNTTQISIDLTESGGPPIITPGGTILRQHRFTDALPEI